MHEYTTKDIFRFWAKVDKSGGPDACWNWTASTNKLGYGRFDCGRQFYTKAHRASWEIAYGVIPDGLFVLHKCDNSSCVNPAHLFLGNQKDNVQDCLSKGRFSPPPHYYGEKHPGHKLTSDDVLAIRKEYTEIGATLTELAKTYGVTIQNIWRIVNNKTWIWLK